MTAWATWQAAVRPDIRPERIDWPALTGLTVAARALKEHIATPAVTDALHTAWSARRFLTSTPLEPNHPASGLQALADELEHFTTAHPDHSATRALSGLATATTDLLTTTSHVGQWLSGVVCQYGARADGRAEAVLVVPRTGWLAPVRAWLDAEELTCVDVATPAQLRIAHQHVAALVLGHPAAVYANAFRPPAAAARENGWLLTAPPAAIVHVGLTADAPALNADELWVWPHADAHPPLVSPDPGATRTPAAAALSMPATAEWFTGAVATHRPARPAAGFDDRDASAAVPVLIAPHLTVYFDPDTGPFPQVVLLEENGDVTVNATTLGRLTTGSVLVVPLDRAARAHLEARAGQWLADAKGWNPARITAAREAALALKLALLWGIAQWSHDCLQAALRDRGIDAAYARNLTHQPLGLTYIAPHRAGFTALLDVLATVPDSRDDWVAVVRAAGGDLVTLRTAHQRAGDLLRRDLRAQLATRNWQPDLEECGWATIHDDTRGTLLLTTVLATGQHTQNVPRTWLAQAIDHTGHRATDTGLKGTP